MNCGVLSAVEPDGRVGIEDFQKMAKALALGLFAEAAIFLERGQVLVEPVVERDAVQPQVGAAASVRAGSQSRWPHWMWSSAAVRNGRDGSAM